MLAVNYTNAQVSVGVAISARIAPPPLPTYVQPPCPVDGYLWTPGYWAWNPDTQDYYWVPGAWVEPPQVGFLWTPPYWGFEGGLYGFHAGYWGPHVGFYGGINYGYGYGGVGFGGGVWAGNVFRYNTAVMRVNTTVIHNTYVDRNVVVNNRVSSRNRYSFNGPGGANAKPSEEEARAMQEDHHAFTDKQQAHEQTARSDNRQFNSYNHGRPQNVSMDRTEGNHFNSRGHMVNMSRSGGGRGRH